MWTDPIGGRVGHMRRLRIRNRRTTVSRSKFEPQPKTPPKIAILYPFQIELLNQAVVLIYNCEFDNYSSL
jgi:hypothetical protein